MEKNYFAFLALNFFFDKKEKKEEKKNLFFFLSFSPLHFVTVHQLSTRGTVGAHIWCVHLVETLVVERYHVLDNG